MRKKIRIDSVEMFEYYDGLVSGLLAAGRSRWLACLLAYDPGTLQRVYLMPDLSPGQAEAIHALVETRGVQALNKRFFSKLSAESDAAFLTRQKPDKGKALEATAAPDDWRDELRKLSFPMIEKAIAPGAISKWLPR